MDRYKYKKLLKVLANSDGTDDMVAYSNEALAAAATVAVSQGILRVHQVVISNQGGAAANLDIDDGATFKANLSAVAGGTTAVTFKGLTCDTSLIVTPSAALDVYIAYSTNDL